MGTASSNSPAPHPSLHLPHPQLQIEDLSAQAQSQAAQQFRAPSMEASAGPTIAEAPAADAGDEGDVDESGVESRDVDLVIQQANVSRAAAVKALRANDGDIVNAIMDLSM